MKIEDNPYDYQSDDTYETWINSLKSQWDRFRSVANKCVDHQTFHEANQTLGYNLAKAVPALIFELERRQQYCDRLSREMLEMEINIAKTRRLLDAAQS